MPIIPSELLTTVPDITTISTPADKKFPTIGTEFPTRYFVTLKKMPLKSDEAVLWTVMKSPKIVTVMPIIHFITDLISEATPVNDISGFILEVKFRTITESVAGNMKPLTISIATADIWRRLLRRPSKPKELPKSA